MASLGCGAGGSQGDLDDLSHLLSTVAVVENPERLGGALAALHQTRLRRQHACGRWEGRGRAGLRGEVGGGTRKQ